MPADKQLLPSARNLQDSLTSANVKTQHSREYNFVRNDL